MTNRYVLPGRTARLKACLFSLLLIPSSMVMASGGYDHGTPAGKGKLDIDLTINPGNKIEQGQTYVVWGYGLTDLLDFHGYVSHEANGTDQIYVGLMYNFYSNARIDLSTAIGARSRKGELDYFFPQLLYTVKLDKGFEVMGSVVRVHNPDLKSNRGVTYDLGLRIPVPENLLPTSLGDVKFTIGAFRGLAKQWNPTYSVDFKF